MARFEGFTLERPSFPVSATAPEPATVIDLRGVASTLWLHRRWVTATGLVCGFLALMVCLLMPTRYEATTKVLLDPRNLQVLQNELNPNTGNGDETELFIQSQLQVVRSTAVLSAVADALSLVHDPAFGDPAPGLLAQVSETLFGVPPAEPAEAAHLRAMRALDHALTVRRPDKTFVLEIGVTTADADRAALIANTVAETFLKIVSMARSENVEKSADALDARLDQLRAQLRSREQAVERYRASNGLVDASGQLVSQQQFSDLNNQLALAQARLGEQAARLKEVQRLRSQGGDPDAGTDAQFTTVSGLRAAYAEARRAKDQAATVYGPRHPATAGLALTVTATRQQLDAELGRITHTAQMDFDRAHASEASLEQRIAELKRTVSGSNESEVGLRELEREATASRSLYETFLNRARDLQERQSLDVINARIITLATPPLSRAGPSRMMILAAGLMLGVLLGFAVALARAQFAEAPPRGAPLQA